MLLTNNNSSSQKLHRGARWLHVTVVTCEQSNRLKSNLQPNNAYSIAQLAKLLLNGCTQGLGENPPKSPKAHLRKLLSGRC